MQKKIRCAIVGVGTRGMTSYAIPIASGRLSDRVKLVGLYDAVAERARLASLELGGAPVYTDFELMLTDSRPDVVVIATKDSEHERYIIKSLELGCNVITEKPMTTSVESAGRIIEAEKKSKAWVRVVFNMRYMKPMCDLKSIVLSGKIGTVRHVNLEWRLDRSHGADYFRRWHRRLENTNSLLVHKSTHHFDILNWLICSAPERVFADCALEFYGKNGKMRAECCHKCNYKNDCSFYFDIAKDDFTRRYFLELEDVSGYYRDGCVFDNEIDIYDRMAVSIRYKNGVTANYSLVAYSPDEGFTISIFGDKGRCELEYAFTQNGGYSVEQACDLIKIITEQGVEVQRTCMGEGDHGGADELIREELFFDTVSEDLLKRRAGVYDGYISLAIGDMAVRSNRLKKPITLECE